MVMYRIVAQVGCRSELFGRRSSTQVPTFYLDGDQLGITNSQHAISIAEDILNPFKDKNIIPHIDACTEEDVFIID